MKLYTCTNCNNPLYFENSTCLNCAHVVGFDANKFNLLTLDRNEKGYSPVNVKNEEYRFCSNATHGTCNWLVPVHNYLLFALPVSLTGSFLRLPMIKTRKSGCALKSQSTG